MCPDCDATLGTRGLLTWALHLHMDFMLHLRFRRQICMGLSLLRPQRGRRLVVGSMTLLVKRATYSSTTSCIYAFVSPSSRWEHPCFPSPHPMRCVGRPDSTLQHTERWGSLLRCYGWAHGWAEGDASLAVGFWNGIIRVPAWIGDWLRQGKA